MKFLIIHGSFASPDSNWFRWLETELKAMDKEVILEQFPTDNWDELNKLGRTRRDEFKPVQSLASWDQYFQQNVLSKLGSEPLVFIGHSIAPVFLLHMIEKYSLKVKLAIFVSPFFDLQDIDAIWQFYPVNKTFYKSDFDFEKLRKLIDHSYVIYGDDDPYVPANQPLEFAKQLNSAAIVVKNGGHLGGKYKQLPLIIELIRKE